MVPWGTSPYYFIGIIPFCSYFNKRCADFLLYKKRWHFGERPHIVQITK